MSKHPRLVIEMFTFKHSREDSFLWEGHEGPVIRNKTPPTTWPAGREAPAEAGSQDQQQESKPVGQQHGSEGEGGEEGAASRLCQKV